MDDTPLRIYQQQVQIWQSKPFEERMRLGCAADAMGLAAAADVAAKCFPNDPAALFLSLHGDSFSSVERERLATAIRRHQAKVSA